ncbi:MAG TPA: AI-2E family transporter [Pseudonocardiaceae bacterium]|jgi:hypothetical protein|nr:AI-2E family transporter [Pseudonocardiaceae bacterium]
MHRLGKWAILVLVLIGLALFLAIGLEPAVSLLARRKVPRWAAVITVLVASLAVVGGFLAAAIPPLARQATQFLTQAPTMFSQLQSQHSLVGRLTGRLQVQVPHSRRPRAILLGDEIFAKVGGYVLGNLLISLIAAALPFTFLVIMGVPYPLLLSIFVTILDLVPVIGSTIAGVVVCLVALSVSLPVCLATIGFFLIYRLAEDYLLVPRIIGRVLKVPALVTVVAVLLGGALLGIVGALIAIPAAAALLLTSPRSALPPPRARLTTYPSPPMFGTTVIGLRRARLVGEGCCTGDLEVLVDLVVGGVDAHRLGVGFGHFWIVIFWAVLAARFSRASDREPFVRCCHARLSLTASLLIVRRDPRLPGFRWRRSGDRVVDVPRVRVDNLDVVGSVPNEG